MEEKEEERGIGHCEGKKIKMRRNRSRERTRDQNREALQKPKKRKDMRKRATEAGWGVKSKETRMRKKNATVIKKERGPK